MAKNEAKIKFKAETGDFNKAISQANGELSNLRGELKLNETQMKGNGRTVEALEKEHSLLENQLKASQDKTQALSQKLEKAIDIFGENSNEVRSLKTQLSNAQIAEEKTKQAIERCNKELSDQANAAKKSKTATAQLTSTIDKQQSEVDELKEAYTEAVLQYGKNSKEAKSLAKEIKKLSGDLSDSKSEFDEAKRAAEKLDKSLDEAGDSARNSGDGFTVAKGAIADLASSAIQNAIGKVSEFVDYLKELPEATREIRQDFATLDTSFTKQGFSTETATQTWKDLYAVFGEDDRAVEAANLISKMSKNQEDLNSWVTITKGVWGTYQDSLPVEGLAEASNETAKTGQVTGVLADALNWSGEAADMFSKYMSEDVTTAEDAFNEALKECTTEEERQALITETLTKLYGGAATEYEKASGSQIEAKEAAADNILVQNELANTIEPLTTTWQGMKNEMLQGVLPAVQKFTEWGQGALGWMKEHPTATKAIVAVIATLAAAVGVLSIAWGVYTVAQWLANSAFLAFALPVLGVVAAIAAVIAIIVLCVKHWDKIKEAGKKAWEGIKNAWNKAAEWFKGVWNGIKNVFSNVKEWFSEKFTAAKNGVLNAWSSVKNWFSNLWSGVKNVFSNVGGWFREKFTSAKQGIQNAWSGVKSFFSNIKNGIVNAFSNVKEKLLSPFTKAQNAIKKVADKIKGFFKGNISMPKIKMPHFSISPSGWKVGDLLKGSIPKLGIKWYADGGIMTKPTIFGMNGNSLMGGGEAGAEAILPIDKLQGYIADTVEKSMNVVNMESLAEAIFELANRPIDLNVNGRQFARATAGDSDSVNGLRSSLRNRGLAID